MSDSEPPGKPPSTDLDGLNARIEALRESRRPPPPKESKYTAASLAWRMVLELVIGMMIGLAIGWGLDFLFGTVPVFLAIFGILGFAAGVRTMMRTAAEVSRREDRRRAEAAGAGRNGGAGTGA